MARVNVYVPNALKLVCERKLGPGWAARCLRAGAMAELRNRGEDQLVAQAAGAPPAD